MSEIPSTGKPCLPVANSDVIAYEVRRGDHVLEVLQIDPPPGCISYVYEARVDGKKVAFVTERLVSVPPYKVEFYAPDGSLVGDERYTTTDEVEEAVWKRAKVTS